MALQFLVASAFSLACVSGLSFNISNVFSHDAVLQRDKPIIVWGWVDSPQSINATWVDGATYPGVFTDTLWRVTFPATPSRGMAPFNLSFESTTGDSVTLSNLLLGDIFSCNGQSNVGAVQVSAMANASDMIAQAPSFSQGLRIFQVSGNLNSSIPLFEWPTSGLVPWQAPIPPNGSNATLLGFSAVCYIYGSTLYSQYLGEGVPIGLVHSSHGGTSIQAWQATGTTDECGDNANSWPSSVLYNSNFHPMTVGPLALKGILYYQGEQDCGIGATETYFRAGWYGCSLQALITGWRTALGDPALFFVVQQLHAWLHTNDIGLATFRQAQLKALLLPNVAISTAFDGGDPASAMAGSPGGTVHSHAKFIPGHRIAAAFAGALYKLPVPYLNPSYRDATTRSFSNATHTTLQVTVTLEEGVGSGVPPTALVQRGWEPLSNSSHCPTERAVNASYCDWFSIQSNDSQMSWHNASVALTGDGKGIVLTAVVPSPGLAAVATRNGFSDWPVVTIYNAAGFPITTWNRAINQ